MDVVPQPRRMRIQSIRFSERIWLVIQQQASEQGISASQYIREAAIGRAAFDMAFSDPTVPREMARVYEAIRALGDLDDE